jgi:hypothetical protein
LVTLWVAGGLIFAPDAHGGLLFRNQAVGGISINVDGIVGQPDVEAQQLLRERMLALVNPSPDPLAPPCELRKISLRKLESSVAEALKNNLGKLPDEIKYLAGIQRIEYLFVYPEQNDIVLAGPGEGWRVDENGNVVGLTTGRPVIPIDDFLTALRAAPLARGASITCSIDPTAQGLRALQQLLADQSQFHPSVIGQMEQTLGPQSVTIRGVPTDTHFARVLVACDYRMKRVAMNLEPSPVRTLPGFLELVQSRRGSLRTMSPRWWLASSYEPLERSPDGLAWRLRGPAVRAMTEADVIAVDGSIQHTGKADPLAQQWADLMTDNYDELSRVDVVFGQLRNLMDLCVVAAVMEREQLLAKANCPLPVLTSSTSELVTEGWNSAKTVATQCSFVRKGRNYLITASGGIKISAWEVLQNTRTDAQLDQTRQRAAAALATATWWAN